jgi:hypothetical protein
MTKTVNEHQTGAVSQTLSGGAKHCLIVSDIIWLEVSRNSKLKVRPCPGQVGHCPVGGLRKMRFSPKIRSFLPKFDSWAIILQIKWNLDTRVTSTQEKVPQRGFPKSNAFPFNFGWIKKPMFWGNEEKSMKSNELEPWIHSKVRGRWWCSP